LTNRKIVKSQLNTDMAKIEKITGVTVRPVTKGRYKGCQELQIHTAEVPPEEMTPYMKEYAAEYDKVVQETIQRLYADLGKSFELKNFAAKH
jgi:Fe2+ transport system protein B